VPSFLPPEPADPADGDLGGLYAALDVPSRTDHLVLVDLPHGGTSEHYVTAAHEAKVLAFALARDYAAAGITGARVVAVARTWACVEQETLLDTGAPRGQA
jgi:hypothetical protein